MNELAKAIVADNVNKTIEKMGSAAYQKIMFLKNLGIRIKRLRDDDLTIATELNKFDPFEEGSDAQGNRIKRLRRIHDEISYFFDEQAAKAKQKEVMSGSKIAKELRLFFSSSNQLVSTFRIARQINAFMTELNSIDALYSSIATDSSGNQNWCTSSEDTSPFPDTNELIGRETDKENIVNMLCNSSNDQVSHPVVAIVGVGGQGKTTLAQYVCQDDRVKSSFHQRLWVYVTPQSSINEILEKIITSATGKKPIYCFLEQLHQQVLQAVAGRKCLLVLDNVYYVDNLRVNVEALNAILKYGGFWGNGGKILITTRSKKAAALMGKPESYELTLVKHLNLSGNPLFELPNEITKMVNLLTLDLSCCINLQELPMEIGELVNLSSLDLSCCCNLEELPRDIGKLVKLRHLWVGGFNLRCMPKGIGNLTELETLDEFVVGKNIRSSRGSKAKAQAKMEDLGHLNNLKGRLRIRLAGQSKYIVSEAGEARLEEKTKLTRLEIVFDKKAKEDEKFLEGIKLSGENWKWLRIMNYGGKRLPVWMTDDQFHKRFPILDYLVLQRKSKYINLRTFVKDYEKDIVDGIRFGVEGNEDDLVEWVPRYSRIKEQMKMGTIELSFTRRRGDGLTLTDDRDITLQDVYLGIKNELAPRYGSGGQRQPPFLLKSCIPNLIHLELKYIPEFEVLPEEFRDLSSLKSLTIVDCPKLKAIPDWIDTLSSLESLYIINAPELEALPDSIGSLTSLRMLSLRDCQRLDLTPHQRSSLPENCRLEFY